MKKSVAAILIIAALILFLAASGNYRSLTGMQASEELPEPPAPPGMEADQLVPIVPPTTVVTPPKPVPKPEDIQNILDKLDELQEGMAGMDAWEQRLSTVEAQLKIASDMSSRLDSLQSQIDAMKVDIENLKQRPSFEAPFFDAINNLQGQAKKNAVLSITLSVLALIIISGMITAGIIQKKHTELEDKKLVRQYLMNYLNAGYKLEMLRMHLLATGWDEKFIDERIKEIPR